MTTPTKMSFKTIQLITNNRKINDAIKCVISVEQVPCYCDYMLNDHLYTKTLHLSTGTLTYLESFLKINKIKVREYIFDMTGIDLNKYNEIGCSGKECERDINLLKINDTYEIIIESPVTGVMNIDNAQLYVQRGYHIIGNSNGIDISIDNDISDDDDSATVIFHNNPGNMEYNNVQKVFSECSQKLVDLVNTLSLNIVREQQYQNKLKEYEKKNQELQDELKNKERQIEKLHHMLKGVTREQQCEKSYVDSNQSHKPYNYVVKNNGVKNDEPVPENTLDYLINNIKTMLPQKLF